MDITSIIITFLEKILPWGIEKFIPLIKIEPKNITFKKSEWQEQLSFFVFNRSENILFDVYIKINVGNCKAEDFKIETKKIEEEFRENIRDISISTKVIRFNCIDENGKDFIVLKILKIDPNQRISFTIKTNSGSVIKLEVLKYSKKQSKILTRKNEIALSFEIPLKNSKFFFGKKKEKVKLKSISLLLRKK
ncbi:hypothetical protein KAW43_01515 [Candidatus Parcubacteria bacterium]|nr:hypothetical protein [Candidatus Parcubacteria bacterium]